MGFNGSLVSQILRIKEVNVKSFLGDRKQNWNNKYYPVKMVMT
jgi:hypothetical protein